MPLFPYPFPLWGQRDAALLGHASGMGMGTGTGGGAAPSPPRAVGQRRWAIPGEGAGVGGQRTGPFNGRGRGRRCLHLRGAPGLAERGWGRPQLPHSRPHPVSPGAAGTGGLGEGPGVVLGWFRGGFGAGRGAGQRSGARGCLLNHFSASFPPARGRAKVGCFPHPPAGAAEGADARVLRTMDSVGAAQV